MMDFKMGRKVLSIALMCLMGGGLAGCDNSSSNDGKDADIGNKTLFVTTTDYTTGNYSTINLDDMAVTKDIPAKPADVIHSDNDAVYYNNKVYLINRLGADNITVLDVADLKTVVNQFSTGNGTNPQDMVFVSDTKAYVSLYASNELLVVDPTSEGGEIKSRIDLSPFKDPADSDGHVEACRMVLKNDYLFVALQRLDGWNAVRKGVIAVIDTEKDEIVDVDTDDADVLGITLTGMNPQSMKYDAGLDRILVTETGSFFAEDGGIEKIDPYDLSADGYLIEESELGGSAVGDFVIVDGTGYAIIGTNYDPPAVKSFDPAAGKVGKEIFKATAHVPGLAVDGRGHVLIPEREDTDSGVRFYDIEKEELGEPVGVGLPPNTILAF